MCSVSGSGLQARGVISIMDASWRHRIVDTHARTRTHTRTHTHTLTRTQIHTCTHTSRFGWTTTTVVDWSVQGTLKNQKMAKGISHTVHHFITILLFFPSMYFNMNFVSMHTYRFFFANHVQVSARSYRWVHKEISSFSCLVYTLSFILVSFCMNISSWSRREIWYYVKCVLAYTISFSLSSSNSRVRFRSILLRLYTCMQ